MGHLYLASFFLTVATTLPHYLNSSFIATTIGEARVSWIYAFSAILSSICLFWLARRILGWGARRILLTLGVIDMAALVALGLAGPSTLGLGIFLVTHVSLIMLGFSMDIYLEQFSRDTHTGRIRGLYLTAANFAWIIVPIISSFLFAEAGYRVLYLTAAFLLIPFLLIIAHLQKSDHTVALTPIINLSWLRAPKDSRERNLRRLWVLDLLLYFFYFFMVVYTPIYLSVHQGLSWTQIGFIFSFMLLPFLLLEYPLGRLADLAWGEKEALVGGVIILAASTITLYFIDSLEIWPWAAALFLTRVGAASIESMKETYLFKKVAPGDTGIVAIFRNNLPLAYIAGPIVATIFLAFFPLKSIFLLVGLTMLLGLIPALRLRDTL